MASMPVKVTKNLRVIVQRDVPLNGGEALELGKQLLAKGAEAIAMEAIGQRQKRRDEERFA